MLLLFGIIGGTAALSALWALHVSHRRHAAIGWMSGQWLAEYQARHPE